MATIKASVWTIRNAVATFARNEKGETRDLNSLKPDETAVTLRGVISKNGQATKSTQLLLSASHFGAPGERSYSSILKVDKASNTVTVTRVETRKGRTRAAAGTGLDTLSALLQ